jgi:hypothetical protein
MTQVDTEYERARNLRIVQGDRTLVVKRSLKSLDEIKAAFPNLVLEVLEELPDWYVPPEVAMPEGWVQHHPYVGDGPIPRDSVTMVDLVNDNMFPIEEDPNAKAG